VLLGQAERFVIRASAVLVPERYIGDIELVSELATFARMHHSGIAEPIESGSVCCCKLLLARCGRDPQKFIIVGA
jgi:hypothetical protein